MEAVVPPTPWGTSWTITFRLAAVLPRRPSHQELAVLHDELRHGRDAFRDGAGHGDGLLERPLELLPLLEVRLPPGEDLWEIGREAGQRQLGGDDILEHDEVEECQVVVDVVELGAELVDLVHAPVDSGFAD